MWTAFRVGVVACALWWASGAAAQLSCPPDSVYGQPPGDPNDFWKWEFSEASQDQFFIDAYDASVPEIDNLTWWGFFIEDQFESYDNCSKETPAFRLYWYADAEGAPGALVCSEIAVPTVTSTQLFYDYFGDQFELLEFSVDLNNLACDERAQRAGAAWLGIEGLGDTNCWYAVYRFNATDNACYVDMDGVVLSTEGDLAFCIRSTPAITGACCFGTQCSVETEDSCIASDGVWQGPETSCEPNPCDPGPLGACCLYEGECDLVTENECYSFEGSWLGPDTTCDPNPCAQSFDDCNENGVPDSVDISLGDSADCDENGVPDECQADLDSDGVIDPCDGCPDDPEKTAPGDCGCGVADTDADGDGTPDCADQCPDDPNKTFPGTCGCGVADVDTDDDGVLDCEDNCPNIFNPTQVDDDEDGMGDACDGDQEEQPEPNEPVDVDPEFIKRVIDTIAGHQSDDPNESALDGRLDELFGDDDQAEQDAPAIDELDPFCGVCPLTSTLLLTATLVGLATTRRRHR